MTISDPIVIEAFRKLVRLSMPRYGAELIIQMPIRKPARRKR